MVRPLYHKRSNDAARRSRVGGPHGPGGGWRRSSRRRRRRADRDARRRRRRRVPTPRHAAGSTHRRRPHGELCAAVEVVAARGDEDDVGVAPGHVTPVHADRIGTGVAEHRPAPGGGHQVGHPVPGGERREVHSSTSVAGGRARRRPPRRPRRAAAAARDDPLGGGFGPGRPPTVSTDASTSSRLIGSSVTTSARQPRYSSASSTTDVDGAHGTQVLGDDHRRVELGEGPPVEVVEVLAGGDALLDGGVDLARLNPVRQRRRRHDAPRREPRADGHTRT